MRNTTEQGTLEHRTTEHRTPTEQWKTNGTTKQQNTCGTVGHWQSNKTKKKTTPRNTTNREPRYIEQIA